MFIITHFIMYVNSFLKILFTNFSIKSEHCFHGFLNRFVFANSLLFLHRHQLDFISYLASCFCFTSISSFSSESFCSAFSISPRRVFSFNSCIVMLPLIVAPFKIFTLQFNFFSRCFCKSLSEQLAEYPHLYRWWDEC